MLVEVGVGEGKPLGFEVRELVEGEAIAGHALPNRNYNYQIQSQPITRPGRKSNGCNLGREGKAKGRWYFFFGGFKNGRK